MDRQSTVMNEVKEVTVSLQADNLEAGQVQAPKALVHFRTTPFQATGT